MNWLAGGFGGAHLERMVDQIWGKREWAHLERFVDSTEEGRERMAHSESGTKEIAR